MLAIVLVYLLMATNFPVVARPVHHHDGVAGRARGRALDAGR